MKRTLCLLTALLLSSVAVAAAPKFAIKNNSSEALVSNDASNAVWHENLDDRIAKIFPVKKFGYISEVSGGFDTSKTCVVTARAMIVPMSGKNFVYAPKQTAVAFGSQAGASQEQCSTMAKAKLKEAIQGVLVSVSK